MTDFDFLPQTQQRLALFDFVHRALELYDLPQGLHITLANLSENATFKLEAPDGEKWAMRVHRAGYHTKLAIASELRWLTDLRATGTAITPVPVKGRDGELIQSFRQSSMQHPRHIVLFKWEPGEEPGFSGNLGAPFEALGAITARMHHHARHWQRPAWFTRFTWDFETSLGEDNPHWGRWRDGMGVDQTREKVFSRTVDLIGRRLAAYGKSPERFGLVHGDLRLANLLVDKNTVKVIDFDDCGFSWFMYDAATPVSFYEHEPQVPELIEHWKQGYRSVAPILKEDEAEIPTFLMLRRLLLVAWIGSHHTTELAKSMGPPYTETTLELCERYLSKHSN